MKKYILLATLSIGCFFIGRYSVTSPSHHIVDWNTDGTELSIMLDNGYEYYATKENNIYTPRFKKYVGFDEILNFSERENKIEIKTVDGNIYEIEKEDKK